MRLAVFPLTPLTGNLVLETAIESIVLAQGDQVLVVACDGMRPHCMLDVFFDRTGKREAECAGCNTNVCDAAGTLQQSQGMTVVSLADLVDPADQQRLFAALDQVADEDLLTYEFDGLPLGRWSQDGLRMAYFGEDWRKLADLYPMARRWLQSMLTTYLATLAVIARHRPDTLLILNGLIPCERVVWTLGKRAGLRSITYEGGQQPGTIFFDADEPACFYDVRGPWQAWRDVPLSRAESLQVNRMMTERMYQAGGGFVYSPSLTGQAVEVLESLGLPADRPLITAFTNCSADTSVYASNKYFARQMDWVDACIAYAAAHPEYSLVVRIHPVEGSSKTMRNSERIDVRDKIIDGIATSWPQLPDNVKVVDSLTAVSSYDLLQVSRLVLAYVSTIALEAACLGLPVIAAGEYHYTDKGIVHTPDSAEAFPGLVDRLMTDPLPPPHAQELARRYLYLWMYRASLPPQALEVVKEFTAMSKLANRPIFELTRGRHAAHDHIVDYLRGVAPQVPAPAVWRPRDNGAPIPLAMPAGFQVIVTPDWDAIHAVALVLCDWARLKGPTLQVQVLADPLSPEEASQRLIQAMMAVAPPEQWPEIDILPPGLPDPALGDVLCRAHALVVSHRAAVASQLMAQEIALPVIAIDDTAAVKAFTAQLHAAAMAHRSLSPIA